MLIFCKRLQLIKEKLKKWNKEVFKNIFKEKPRLEEELNFWGNQVIEKAMSQN